MKNKIFGFLRAVVLFFVFMFLIIFADEAAFVYQEILGNIVSSVIFIAAVPMIMNSCIRLVYTGKGEYESFLLSKPAEFDRGKELVFVLRSFDYLCGLITVLCLSSIFSTNVFSERLAYIIPLPDSWLVKKVISAALITILFSVIFLFSKVNIREKWFYGVASYHKKAINYIFSFVKYAVVYIYGIIMLSFLISRFKTLFVNTGAYKTDLFSLLLWLPLLFFAIKYISMLSKRIKFIKNLKKSCSIHNFKLSSVKRPYMSVFKNCDDANFTVEANGKKYDCRLLSGKGRGVAMILFPDGEGLYKYSFKLRGVELHRHHTQFSYGYESENTKCVIITAVPNTVFVGEGEKTKAIFTGDKVGSYYYFEPQAFINNLERDCIERRI